jgi:hypothetical protein
MQSLVEDRSFRHALGEWTDGASPMPGPDSPRAAARRLTPRDGHAPRRVIPSRAIERRHAERRHAYAAASETAHTGAVGENGEHFASIEVCDLRRDQVDFTGAVMHVRRVKNGTPSTHPIQGDELRALRRLQRESPSSPFVFVSERGSPFTTAGFARIIERAADGAALEIKPYPHMLRHACGYALPISPRDEAASAARANPHSQ